jgi:hypothetical protein
MPEPARRILFRVRRTDAYHMTAVIVHATTREFAVSHAQPCLGGDPNNYEVEPITAPGEPIQFLLFTY